MGEIYLIKNIRPTEIFEVYLFKMKKDGCMAVFFPENFQSLLFAPGQCCKSFWIGFGDIFFDIPQCKQYNDSDNKEQFLRQSNKCDRKTGDHDRNVKKQRVILFLLQLFGTSIIHSSPYVVFDSSKIQDYAYQSVMIII